MKSFTLLLVVFSFLWVIPAAGAERIYGAGDRIYHGQPSGDSTGRSLLAPESTPTSPLNPNYTPYPYYEPSPRIYQPQPYQPTPYSPSEQERSWERRCAHRGDCR